MNIPIDIHTHQLPQVAGEAILNCDPDTFVPHSGGWYSVGIHPWKVESAVLPLVKLRELANHPQVLAIGEAGLDKLVGGTPLPIQVEAFANQARLAMEVDKPLIIHLVKATDELLKLKQVLNPSNPWIIHGFRGKATLAQEYLKHGFYLSFGEKYQKEALCITPIERLFIETDESSVALDELYKQAARVRNVAPDELQKTVQQTISAVFFKQ